MKSYTGVILYAKNWFKQTDLFEDLKKLWDIDYGPCGKNDVVQLTLLMAEKLVEADTNRRLFCDFVNDLNPENHWKFPRENESNNFNEFQYSIIIKSLSLLRNAKAMALEGIFGELTRPDFSILPMREGVDTDFLERLFPKEPYVRFYCHEIWTDGVFPRSACDTGGPFVFFKTKDDIWGAKYQNEYVEHYGAPYKDLVDNGTYVEVSDPWPDSKPNNKA